MKKTKLAACLMLLLSLNYLKAQFVQIPDANFRAYLKTIVPQCFNANDELNTEHVEVYNNIKTISLNNTGTQNLDGIQYFTGVATLFIFNESNLTSISNLPNNIETILLSSNPNVTNIGTLPSNLKNLTVSYCNISSLPALPNSLIFLFVDGNKLNTLPPLPSGLKKLSVSFNQFDVLPPLPNGLEYLGCNDNNLVSLPQLPLSIAKVFAANNCISSPMQNFAPFIELYPNKPTCSSFVISDISGPSKICQNESQEFEYSVSGNPYIKNFNWQTSPNIRIVTGQFTNKVKVSFIDNSSGWIKVSADNYDKVAEVIISRFVDNLTITATANPAAVCSGSLVTLNASGNFQSIQWDDPAVVNNRPFKIAVTKTFKATAIDANGCKKSQFVRANVTPTPEVSIVPSRTTICAGQGVSMMLVFNEPTTYTWTGCDYRNGYFYPTQTTTYSAICVNAAGCSTTVSQTIQVNPSPDIEITPIDTILCQGEQITLTAYGNMGNLSWSNGVQNGVAFVPTTSETYTVTAPANQFGCSAQKNKTVLVNTTPYNTTPIENLTICKGTATTLYATGTSVLYWYNVPTEGNPIGAESMYETSPLTQSTTFYVADVQTCGSNFPRTPITVTVLPDIAEPTAQSYIEYTIGDIASPLVATGENVLWYTSSTGGTALSTAPTPSTTVAGNITYYVSQTVNGCESVRKAIIVTVKPSSADISGPSCFALNSDYVFTLSPKLTVNATSYNWSTKGNVGDVQPRNSKVPTTVISSGSNFSGTELCVTVHYSTNPSTRKYCTTINPCTSVSKRIAEGNTEEGLLLTATPNPFQDKLDVQTTEPVYNVTLVNSIGVVVYKKTSISGEELISIDASLASGVYTLKYSDQYGNFYSKKLLKL